MKLSKLFMGLTAAAMFAACADDLNTAEVNNGQFNADGDGYLKIAIAMPQQTVSSRATLDGALGSDYGQFNDGEKYEYAVESAILVLFSGTGDDESQYKLHSAYNLNNGEWKDDTSAQITVDRTMISKINKGQLEQNEKLYAFVILNQHDFFEVGSKDNQLYIGDSAAPGATSLKNKTLAEFMKIQLNETDRKYDAHSFFMSNMPWATVPGGTTAVAAGVKVNTLYPIDMNLIKETFEDANVGEAATTVNVERALAKVSVHWDDAAMTTQTNSYKAEVLGWFIDNTNPTVYVTRNFLEDETAQSFNASASTVSTEGLKYLGYKNQKGTYVGRSRMISSTPVTANNHRTYWGIDPNYDRHAYTADGKPELVTKEGVAVDNTIMQYDDSYHLISGQLRPNNTYYYCTENTFDVYHQSEFNTTRVVVAAQFNEGNDFYCIDVEPGVMYQIDAMKSYVMQRLMERVNIQQWFQKYIKPEYYDGHEADEVKYDGTQFFKITYTYPNGKTDAELAVERKTADDLQAMTIAELSAYYQEMSSYAGNAVASVELNDLTDEMIADGQTKNGAEENFETNLNNNNEYLKANFHLSYYVGGVSYYSALIKHFGDYETPWERSDDMANVTSSVYLDKTTNKLNSAAFLGRYGVLRNNWYDVRVDGIRQIGSPVVPPLVKPKTPGDPDPNPDPDPDPENPTVPDVPDDQVENYLKVTINITPWAMRKQNTTL